LENPDSVVWSGSTDLPVIQDLRPLGDLMVVLLTETGGVLRYNPVTDQLEQVARISADAEFGGAAESAVALIDFESQVVHEIATDHTAEYPMDESVIWASPVDGGLAVLTDSDPPRLRLSRRADAEVVLDTEVAGRPALITAWGKQAVLVGPDRHTVQIYATDNGSLVGEVDVGGSISALAASPSSHEIYVAIDDPPGIAVVNRLGLSARQVTGSAAPIQELRAELFGGSILIRTQDGIGQIGSGDLPIRPVAGTWRSDLPLGLSSDRTIILDDDEAHLQATGNSVSTVLAGGAPTWWVPLRWNPGVLSVVDETVPTTPSDDQAPDEALADPDGLPTPTSDVLSGQAGHYAIVVSARQRSGVADLLSTLAAGGYPTRLQQFPDEAGSIWFRGLVGPYPTRGRAQAAARQLQREYDLQAWVTELGGTR
jgi:hypothetical protein